MENINKYIKELLHPAGGHQQALIQVMAWHWTGDKPLHEPMMTQFPDAYKWH